MQVEQNNYCAIGDLVKVDYSHPASGTAYKWVGLLLWTCGHKYTFLINGVEETWVKSDLEVIDAKVVGHAS